MMENSIFYNNTNISERMRVEERVIYFPRRDNVSELENVQVKMR